MRLQPSIVPATTPLQRTWAKAARHTTWARSRPRPARRVTSDTGPHQARRGRGDGGDGAGRIGRGFSVLRQEEGAFHEGVGNPRI